MKFTSAAIVLSAYFLSGCGATVSNTDKPIGLYISGAETVPDDFSVAVVSTLPSSGGKQISGISCKNKVWDPTPTNDAAITVLKREVMHAGFNSVVISSVGPDPAALMKNCWSAIIATGTAFNK